MKIRTGFVSNSSSSSFIIGLAVIADEEKFGKWFAKEETVNAMKHEEVYAFKLNDAPYQVKVGSEDIHIDSFTDERVSIRKEAIEKLLLKLPKNVAAEKLLLDEDFRMFAFSMGGGDDSDFWNGDEYDYDIDFDFFSANEQYIAESLTEENGFALGGYEYGAGRNG